MKTSEMIAMLEENPKLRFRRKNWIYNNNDVYVSTNEHGMIKLFNSIGTLVFYINHNDWQLVREPVPVWEAIKALVSDRQTIRGVNQYGEFTITPDKLESSQQLALRGLKDCSWFIGDE